MKILQQYFALQKKNFDYFGYVEDWKTIPLDDATECYWQLTENEDGSGYVRFHEELKKLSKESEDDGDYYESEIYTQRFLPKWVYPFVRKTSAFRPEISGRQAEAIA